MPEPTLPAATREDLPRHFAAHRDLDGIAFPVLAFRDGEGIGPARDAAELRLATAMGLEAGDHAGMELFDAAGRHWICLGSTPELDLGPTGVTRWVACSFRMHGPRANPFPAVRERVATRGGLIEAYADQVRACASFDELYRLVRRLHPHAI